MTGIESASRPSPATIERLEAGVPAAFAMLAGMQLGVFTALGDGPRTAGELAAVLDVTEERLSRLLYGLVVAGLLEQSGDRFRNTAESDAYLVKDRPGSLSGAHELMGQLWHADLQTAQSIRSGRPAALHDFDAASDADMMAMLRGMHPYAVAAGRLLAGRFDFAEVRSVLDVGGGSGGLIAALCEAHPGLQGTLFELSRNAALARDILKTTPGGDAVTIAAGDILTAPPPGPFDAVVLRALVQVLPPADAARAIANAAAALRPGGSLYILGGGILDDDRLGPRFAVFLNVTFLNLYTGGRSYTEAEHVTWLAAAGCAFVERITLPSGGGIIRATKPSA